MFPEIKTPILYAICLAAFVFLSIKELTRVKKLTRFEAWNSCVWDELNNGKWEKATKSHEFWSNSTNLLSKCMMILEQQPTKLPNSKLYIFPRNLTTERVHVSFGIEADGSAELQMKTLSPNTIFFATDINGTHESVREIGTVLPLLIGQESGLVESTIPGLNGTEASGSILKIDMIYFLRNILNRDFYDSVWINLKPTEFPVMKAFLKGAQFDKNSMTICQINFKIERSVENEADFHRFFINLVGDRRYAMFIEPSETYHTIFLVNFGSGRCREMMGELNNE